MLAILEDAFACFEKHLLGNNRSSREEMSWFMNKSSEPLFSFQNICDALRLDAGYLRKYLMQRSALIARQFLPGSFSPAVSLGAKTAPAQKISPGEFSQANQDRSAHARSF